MRHYALAATLFFASQASASDGPSLCANTEQSASVRALYATAPVPPTFMAATRLGMSEAIVASALAGKETVGTSGAGFTEVWASLEGWGSVTVAIIKGGQVFEVHGPVPAGAPSTKSQSFNLQPEGVGLGGHLRPDKIGAIYAIDIVSAQGPVRGVTFLDAAGEGIFGVYLPEGAEPSPEQLKRFEQTRAVISSLARVCN
jgi:putative heme iron utilization protein